MNGPRMALAVCGVAALLAGCSENAGESVIPDQATQQAGDGSITIEARDFAFLPERAEAETSSVTIELRNEGAERHSLTVYTNDQYEEPVPNAVIEPIGPGESATITFSVDQPGTFNFRCEVHPGEMNGELSVGGTSGPTTTTGPGSTPGATTTQED